jgi:cyclohexanecarboxylate-CoA ligase
MTPPRTPRIPTRLTAEAADRLTRGGHWPNTTFAAALLSVAGARSGKTAVVDDRRRLTYAELRDRTLGLAGALAARGVGTGDVVSAILPNRAEAVALFYAANRLGAAVNPIVPIYGAREIRFILRQVESAAIVVPDRFRGVDFPALVDRLAPDVPSLGTRIVVGETAAAGWLPFGELWDARRAGAPPALPGEASDPNAVTTILYTSGTTADPKGVLHSDNTLLCECRTIVRHHRLGADEVFVMPSPVSHISGLLYGIMLPVVLGATSVLMETWDPELFLTLVEREGGTYSAGATPFLQGILDCPRLDRYDTRTLRIFPCGGADVPPDLIRRAIRRLGVRSGRGYGSTEFPSITSSAGPDVPETKRALTDGVPIGANEIELRDSDGRRVAAGEEGEIWARGPELCLGYRDPALDAEAFDARGFFRTGDLGVLDGEAYLTVTGRLKDIIVRGGEKLSAKEIEDLLFEHPAVKGVAVVPMPDPALGERVCAFVVPARPEAPPTLPELVRFLEAKELSRRKLPERLEVVDELPTTASGKVAKHLLKERLARSVEQEREGGADAPPRR